MTPKLRRVLSGAILIGGLLPPAMAVSSGNSVVPSGHQDPVTFVLLELVAILSKQICGFVIRIPGVDRVTVGIGMIPRGEVGIIFAAIGRELSIQGQPVINEGIYSALLIMVMLTAMITPPLLRWSTSKIDEDLLKNLGRSGSTAGVIET